MDDILQIKILGTTLSIKSGSNPDYIKKVITYYQRKLQETENRSPLQDPLKISILTSFNIIDELFKMEVNRGQDGISCSTIDDIEIAETAQNMINEIDQVLKEQ